ncbi:MAG: leucine-rich repeat domain-containing protein [Promethearchaeota archaeon]
MKKWVIESESIEYNKYNLKADHLKVLKELEELIHKSIPRISEVNWGSFGVEIKDNEIVGIGLFDCKLNTLPNSIIALKSLKSLFLPVNQFKTFPSLISKLLSLEYINLDDNLLNSIPDSISNLTSLKSLSLACNQIFQLPDSIAQLRSLETILLWSNKLQSFPDSILQLESLIELDISDNNFNLIPNKIDSLKSLEYLGLAKLYLEELPISIGNLESLQTLILNSNQLKTLPKTIGDLSSLEYLDIRRNKFNDLPDSMSRLNSLKKLRVERNVYKINPKLEKFKPNIKMGYFASLIFILFGGLMIIIPIILNFLIFSHNPRSIIFPMSIGLLFIVGGLVIFYELYKDSF